MNCPRGLLLCPYACVGLTLKVAMQYNSSIFFTRSRVTLLHVSPLLMKICVIGYGLHHGTRPPRSNVSADSSARFWPSPKNAWKG